MKDYHRIEINGRVLCVSFKSTYQGVSDYEVSNRGEYAGRVSTFQTPDTVNPSLAEIRMEHDADKAARFERENGFPWADAVAAVRRAMAEQFDADTREIVNRNGLEYADPCVRTRAIELGLVASPKVVEIDAKEAAANWHSATEYLNAPNN